MLLLPIAFAGTSINVELPKKVNEKSYFNINLTIKTSSEKMDIVEFMPKYWQISNWSVSPNVNAEFESQAQTFLGKEREMNHWKFNPIAKEITIKMKVLSKEKGEYEFITLWMTPDGFDKISNKLNVVEKTSNSVSPSTITGFAIKDLENSQDTEVINQSSKTNNIERSICNLSEIKGIIFNIPY